MAACFTNLSPLKIADASGPGRTQIVTRVQPAGKNIIEPFRVESNTGTSRKCSSKLYLFQICPETLSESSSRPKWSWWWSKSCLQFPFQNSIFALSWEKTPFTNYITIWIIFRHADSARCVPWGREAATLLLSWLWSSGTMDGEERHIARQAIKDISSDPLNALLTSPTDPQQIYGEVRPDCLVSAFSRVSSRPTCEQSRRDLSVLLARVDERRRQRYTEQCESDEKDDWRYRVSGRPELIGLVETLEQIKRH